ncbi:DUF6979 family protein [Chlorobium limicola]|nr:hypothetical protein [Chlorobium limicola]
MNKYDQSAVEAAMLCSRDNKISPRMAWDQVSSRIFGKGTSSQKKGCPRDAYLGFCEEGHVKDIPTGNYCNSSKNKSYALSALALLTREPNLANQPPKRLWERIMMGEQKVHNSQMDVVVAMWKAGLLIPINGD